MNQTLLSCAKGTKVGGLTESWRIAWMAYEHNIQWVPHGWNTAIGLAAALTRSPSMEEIFTTPFQVDTEGYLPIPDKPGLGIELDREALKRYGGWSATPSTEMAVG